jgi:FAD/FMN-containing dehydrogenase
MNTPDHSALLATLASAIGAANVLTDPLDTAPFAEDWRKRYRGEALCVALPGSTAEVAAVMAACHAAGVRVLPQGGNTGLVGAATPIGGQRADGSAPVIVALRRLNRIRSVDPIGNVMVAEAGCVLTGLHEAAALNHRLYPVTLGAQGSCQIGGTISTNAGGTGVLKYGNTREQVLGLEVVLPDGRVWNGLRPLRKDNTGYALKHLFVGAEGTLGIVTAASLRLHPMPVVWAAAWLTLDSVEHALRAFAALQSTAGDRIGAYELMNDTMIAAVGEHLGRRPPCDPQAPYAVLVELADTYPRADLQGLMESVLATLSEEGVLRDAVIATSGAQRAAFWSIRHGVADANLKAGMSLACDVAVPVGAAATFVERASRAVRDAFPQVAFSIVGHLGDGNLHYAPRFAFDDWRALPDPAQTAIDVRRIVHDVAVSLDGTFSAEHGIGHVLVDELRRLRDPLELELMTRVRAAIDPGWAMNPGKVLRAPE